MLRARSMATAALALGLLVPLAGCGSDATSPPPDRTALSGAGATPGTVAAKPPERSARGPRVLAISVDGLNPDAITRLGPRGAPTLHRLLAEGAGTLNARTESEQTVTLPNHTSMMTGRRIDASQGGHGVTWDDHRPGATVQEAAHHPVASIFGEVDEAGGSTALYSTKTKFGLYRRSWSRGIDRFTVREDQEKLVHLATADLTHGTPTFTFLHVSLPDRTGHASGGMSRAYVAAVRRTDVQLGTVVRALAGTNVVLVLTSDHGFARGRTHHSAKWNVGNFRIPFVVWGRGVDHGDLYQLNPDFRDPGTRQLSYDGKQPVRNGDVANLAADLLGLPAVPGSGIGHDQSLDVTRTPS